MIKIIFINSLRLLILISIQIILLNHINLHNTINPFLYILFILLLPLDVSVWMMTLLGFFTGLLVDLFMNTPGLHAAATTLMAYARPYILRFVTPRGGYEHEPHPGIKNLGFRWFFTYSAVLTLIHHLFLFYLDVFRWSEFFFTFFRVILSSSFTLTLIIITQYLFIPIRRK